jgi:hypothetical protein
MQAEELNPYLKNGGNGYPDEEGERKAGHSGIIPTAKVGDGGASWRLKALKRAQVRVQNPGRPPWLLPDHCQSREAGPGSGFCHQVPHLQCASYSYVLTLQGMPLAHFSFV